MKIAPEIDIALASKTKRTAKKGLIGIGLGIAESLAFAKSELRYLNIGIAIKIKIIPISGKVMMMFSGEIGIAPPLFTTICGNR